MATLRRGAHHGITSDAAYGSCHIVERARKVVASGKYVDAVVAPNLQHVACVTVQLLNGRQRSAAYMLSVDQS